MFDFKLLEKGHKMWNEGEMAMWDVSTSQQFFLSFSPSQQYFIEFFKKNIGFGNV